MKFGSQQLSFGAKDEEGTPSPVTTEHHDDDDDDDDSTTMEEEHIETISGGKTKSSPDEDRSTMMSAEEGKFPSVVPSSTNTIASVVRKQGTNFFVVEQTHVEPLDTSQEGASIRRNRRSSDSNCSAVTTTTAAAATAAEAATPSLSSSKETTSSIMAETESNGEEKKMECEGVAVVSEEEGGGSSKVEKDENESSGPAVVVADSVETTTEDGDVDDCWNNANSGSKIDPDGSTACLSKSHQSTEEKKPVNNTDESIIEETAAPQKENDEQPMEGIVVDDTAALSKEVQAEDKQQVPKENGIENCNGKEAVDAPSAASLETESAGTIEAGAQIVAEKGGDDAAGDEEEGPIIGDITGAPSTLSEGQINNNEAVMVVNNNTEVEPTDDVAKNDHGQATAVAELTMDGDASGRIARSNSNQHEFDVMDTSGFSQSSEVELMKASSTSDDSQSSLSRNNNKSNRSTGMDASGRTSLDLELEQQMVAKAEEEADIAQQSSFSSVVERSPETPESVGLRTPLSTVEKEASEATVKAATPPAATRPEVVEVVPQQPQQQQSQLSPDILAIKDKESFGLLARGESFKGQPQLQQQQQQQQQPTHDVLVGHRRLSNQHRVPQDPAAFHQRGDSSVASLSRMNSGQELLENGSSMIRNPEVRVLDENYDNSHNMPLDDNSWRPSQVSYPSSPQGLPAPQAIPLNNGGYMVMPPPHVPSIPHHPGQPPQHAFMAPGPQPTMLHHQSSFHSQQQQQQQLRPSYGYQPMPVMAPMPAAPNPAAPVPGGKRKIKLRLQEEIQTKASHLRRASFFRSTRRLMMSDPMPEPDQQVREVDRGTISVSWFEGTSSIELQEHVNRSVERKLKLENNQQLDDIRILDTKVDPPEEIVLCPYIPSGSEFVLRYKLKPLSGRSSPTFYGPPDSPSAAPSPHPANAQLDSAQLAVLKKQLDAVHEGEKRQRSKHFKSFSRSQMTPMNPNSKDRKRTDSPKESRGGVDSDNSDGDSDTLQPESSVDAQLRQIRELLLVDRQKQLHQHQRYPRVEKRQVVFVLANYFVLFVAFITILAEMQARAPAWLKSIESQLENVQTCSSDQEALFKCVSNGEFAGLFATVILWLSRSATTKQIFLLGFDSPQKLWIVFYESLVGAFCWGISYMFIRRGMNPDTRPQFLQKYWKDCMYGSLAGFNATFMKSVLKNLIPREAVEEAFNDRQLKILSWLPTFS